MVSVLRRLWTERTLRRPWAVLGVGFLVLLLLRWMFGIRTWDAAGLGKGVDLGVQLDGASSTSLPCRRLRGANDVLVVVKTSADEAHRKLPVHFRTTLRCVPYYVVFSDLEEDVNGHRLHDSLDEIDEKTRLKNSEFDLYNRLQRAKGSMTKLMELENMTKHEESWDLDKWKLLPLMEKALLARPQAKWFVFIETDTYLMWSNMLKWLSKISASKPYYLGGQSALEDVVFANSGGGIFVSKAAIRKLVEYRKNHMDELDDLTAERCCGDVILALAFQKAGINLFWSWPMVQGDSPSTVDYSREVWCHPVISYHQMSPEDIEAMWSLEQRWIESNSLKPLLHGDVYDAFMEPQISGVGLGNWDSLSAEGESRSLETDSVDRCREACIFDHECLQYTYRRGPRECRLAKEIRFGQKSQGVHSGWMVDKLKLVKDKWRDCTPQWLLP